MSNSELMSSQSHEAIRLLINDNVTLDDAPLSPGSKAALNAIGDNVPWQELDAATQSRVHELQRIYPSLFSRRDSDAAISNFSSVSHMPETPTALPRDRLLRVQERTYARPSRFSTMPQHPHAHHAHHPLPGETHASSQPAGLIQKQAFCQPAYFMPVADTASSHQPHPFIPQSSQILPTDSLARPTTSPPQAFHHHHQSFVAPTAAPGPSHQESMMPPQTQTQTQSQAQALRSPWPSRASPAGAAVATPQQTNPFRRAASGPASEPASVPVPGEYPASPCTPAASSEVSPSVRRLFAGASSFPRPQYSGHIRHPAPTTTQVTPPRQEQQTPNGGGGGYTTSPPPPPRGRETAGACLDVRLATLEARHSAALDHWRVCLHSLADAEADVATIESEAMAVRQQMGRHTPPPDTAGRHHQQQEQPQQTGPGYEIIYDGTRDDQGDGENAAGKKKNRPRRKGREVAATGGQGETL